jgi:hypothetical protein
VAPFDVARLTLSAVPALRMAYRCVGPSVKSVPRAARYGRTSPHGNPCRFLPAYHQRVGRAAGAAQLPAPGDAVLAFGSKHEGHGPRKLAAIQVRQHQVAGHHENSRLE